LKNLDAQEIEKNRQLNNVSTTRQYYSLEHELEDIKKQKDNLENTLLSLLNEIQDLNLLYQDTVLNVKEKKENLIKDMQNFEKRLFDLDNQINLESDYRDKLELEVQQIIPEFLEQYSLLKSSVSNPAVKLRDSSCSACFYQLTLNELSKIKEHKIGRCQECYRFLYL
jgi:predicted  nucleic acid-binding Zn-ribbon protein